MFSKKITRFLVGAVAVGTLAAGAVPALGDTATVDVVLAALGGSRVLSVTTVAGADLNGGNLDLGEGASGGFGVAVTDANYSHVGYQVSATMSNLYLWNAGAYDCGTRLGSGNLAVRFPVRPTVEGLGEVVNGVVDLRGTLTGPLVSAIDPTGAVQAALTAAGGPSLVGQPIEVDGLVSQWTDTVSGLLDGASALLPVKANAGSAGAFTDPAAHPSCGQGAGSPTSRLLMRGDASSPGAFLTQIEQDIATAVEGVSGSELVSGGVVDAADAQAGAAAALQQLHDDLEAAAGVSLPPFTIDVAAILGAVTGAVSDTDLVGQSGVYLTVPVLDADTDSAPASGTYRGTMVVTLVDTP